MSPFTSLCIFLLFSVVAILAAPLDSRTVFDPPITSPTAQTVWKVGSVETVTWNATGIPAGVTGKIMLGFLSSTSEGEHLSDTLASGFNLTDEKVDVTVPQVATGTQYIIVLFGDSGNFSPTFTIQGSSSSTSSGGTSTSAESSPSTGTSSISRQTVQTVSTLLPTPPIATSSSSAPISTSTAPSSSSGTSSPGTSSPSLPTSSSPASSSSASASSPSSSPNTSAAGWSMNKLKTYQLFMAPAVLLLFI
ncbi:hypothetical protein B0H16DRAFT_1876838 [Mycena metata]|uniref:Yeast cell wall synthesis Kre9/Knh1-like N-terminal domain-containing protein n=1 Tax=Mycena metata TaxID=1033252 RepID=A0AAD7KF36_9AGAR|nr:hypothetical protein B0H16DRAFT_1876838 [Mycena metata]